MSLRKPHRIILYRIAIGIMGFVFLLWLKDVAKELSEYKAAQGGIAVVFHKEIDERELSTFAVKYEEYAAVKRHKGDFALFAVKTPFAYHDIMAKLQAEALVLSAEANYGIQTMGYSGDYYSDTQWYIENPGQYTQILSETQRIKKTIQDIDMDVASAWEVLKGAAAGQREVIVAVIDTGVDYTHPDLAENMWINPGEIDGDGIDNDNNGYIDDVYGWDFYNNDASVCHYDYDEQKKAYVVSKEDNDNHGTHIAGVIGAVADNDIGIAGIASKINIKIMALKITGGEKGKGNPADAIEAIKYATMMGADICNLSWGTTVQSLGLMKVMRESDMFFVAAAGNSGSDNDKAPMYPAGFELDNLISITAVNSYGEIPSYSNYGLNTVDLAAPGDDIYSTIIGGYASMSGSSMAVPQVCGVAALLYSDREKVFAANIKEMMIRTMKPLKSLEGEIIHAGIPNAYQAVINSANLLEDNAAPILTFDTIYNKGVMTVPVKAEDPGASGLRVVKWIIGEKRMEDFWRGVNGSTVNGEEVSFAKAGTYTFYASDYAGNENIYTYEVMEDRDAPELTVSYTVANDYKYRTVTVKATDDLSGMKRIKYMAGKKTAEDFLPEGAGVVLELKNGKANFRSKEDGVFTIFASDNRGNNVIKLITVKTLKATDLAFLISNRTLYTGEHFTSLLFLRPVGTTDKITYTSLNTKVAIVSSTGRVTALSPGITYIKVKTSSGLTAVCTVIVRNRPR